RRRRLRDVFRCARTHGFPDAAARSVLRGPGEGSRKRQGRGKNPQRGEPLAPRCHQHTGGPVAQSAQADNDIFSEAPPEPRRWPRFFLGLAALLLLLVWSFQGAKIRPAELVRGVPQIVDTINRMLPPDFSRVTDAHSYFLPEGLSLSKLLLPLPM